MKRVFLSLAAALLIQCLASGLLNAQTTVDLFNGKDLSGWGFVVQNDAAPAAGIGEIYSVADGTVTVRGAPMGYMHTLRQYGNFILHVEWRWVGAPANSGIFVLQQDLGNPLPRGIQCQVKGGSTGDLVMMEGARLTEYRPDPAVQEPHNPVLPKKNPSSEKPAGEWNTTQIVVKDGFITVYVNGTYQNSAAADAKTGYIALQCESGKPVQFRNIRLTEW